MTTAELMMAWPRLFESELAEPILSVMDGLVRVRARVLRPLLRVLCPRAPTRRPHTHAVRPWLLPYCAVPRVVGWLASALMSCELLLARRSSRGGSST
jgi:hypothetical protein